MSKMLIAAAAIGATTAALILYFQRRNSVSGRLKGAGKDVYKTINSGPAKTERLGTSAMG